MNTDNTINNTYYETLERLF